MLRAIRKSAGSWVVRIFLLMLAALFGVGIWSDPGSMLRGRSSNSIASVGGVDIDTATFGREYQADATRARAVLGARFDTDPATKTIIAFGTIERLATGTQIALEAEQLGLAVGDDAIRQDVLGNPAFHDDAGAFSQDLFLGRLAQQGLTEASYVALLRADLVGRQLIGSVTAVANVPATLAERIYEIRNEARIADYLVVSAASRPLPPDPDDATLQEFYDAHIDLYTAPEYRSVTYLRMRPADLLAEVGVGDDEVKALYDQRIDSFRRPERRTVEQILLPDKAAAEAVVKRVADGEAFAAVAASVGQGPDQTALGGLTATDLPLPVLADAVFALAEDGVSAPVESPLGWHVLHVTAIAP
ncbi:MAG: SurA N-terminal domain-containing protein, partial [Alphaproteobacteria bacterium]